VKGFAFPRRFKSAASLLATLTRNNRELLAFLNNFVIRFDADGSTVTLPGDLSVAGDLSGLTWQAWAPSYTNLTIGNGTVVARYVQIGNTVVCYFAFTLGSSSAVGTNPTVTTPVTASSTYLVGSAQTHIGTGMLSVAGATQYPASVTLGTADRFDVFSHDSSVAVEQIKTITATSPGTWTTGNILTFSATYEAA